jgi:hypothetical protein
MDTTTYTAVCERAGRWWTIRIPQIDGLTAQVRNLDQAEMIARQSIARALGVPSESITVDVIPEAPVVVTQALQARHAARQALEAAVQSTLAALDTLAQEGYKFHDAVAMLGLSPAEVEQYAPGGFDHADPSPASGPTQVSGPMQMVGK